MKSLIVKQKKQNAAKTPQRFPTRAQDPNTLKNPENPENPEICEQIATARLERARKSLDSLDSLDFSMFWAPRDGIPYSTVFDPL